VAPAQSKIQRTQRCQGQIPEQPVGCQLGLRSPPGLGVSGGFSHRCLRRHQHGLQRLCVATQNMPVSGKSATGEQQFPSTTRGAEQLTAWFQPEVTGGILPLFFLPSSLARLSPSPTSPNTFERLLVY